MVNEQETIKSRGDESPPQEEPALMESPHPIEEMPENCEFTAEKITRHDSSELIEPLISNHKPYESLNTHKQKYTTREKLKDLEESIAITTQGNEIPSNLFGPEDYKILLDSDEEAAEIKPALKLLVKNFEKPGKVLKNINIADFDSCSDTILEEFTKIHFVFLKLQREKDTVIKNIW
jgi:hypothetical protein